MSEAYAIVIESLEDMVKSLLERRSTEGYAVKAEESLKFIAETARYM